MHFLLSMLPVLTGFSFFVMKVCQSCICYCSPAEATTLKASASSGKTVTEMCSYYRYELNPVWCGFFEGNRQVSEQRVHFIQAQAQHEFPDRCLQRSECNKLLQVPSPAGDPTVAAWGAPHTQLSVLFFSETVYNPSTVRPSL